MWIKGPAAGQILLVVSSELEDVYLGLSVWDKSLLLPLFSIQSLVESHNYSNG